MSQAKDGYDYSFGYSSRYVKRAGDQVNNLTLFLSADEVVSHRRLENVIY